MQAKEMYELGRRAYNGDRTAAMEYFERLSPIAIAAARTYGVLPSFILAKSAIESGWMTNIWNEKARELTGKQMMAKAGVYNNVFSMNCFDENQRYLDRLPLPEWTWYRTTFEDWGPHGCGDSLRMSWEPWKSYRSVEDAVGDWCANIRYQAEAHGKHWNPTNIVQQMLATESYTPEGSPDGVRDGLHYQWQEQVMKLYEGYGLRKYDKEVDAKVSKVKMTTGNLDAHIKAAYEYAHRNCHYAPCTGYPPMENGCADCAGLALKALRDMGYVKSGSNIDMVPGLCAAAGMTKSTDINDVWRHHGVVCMQDVHLAGTQHVSHVYYSLGGKSVDSISKFDLGSDDRIKKHTQPYASVPVNEWPDKYHFLMFFYPKDEEKRGDEPDFDPGQEAVGVIRENTGIYAGPGTKWKKLKSMAVGTVVRYGHRVTNDSGKDWRRVVCGDTAGYVYHAAVAKKGTFESYEATVRGTDGSLALRVAAGVKATRVAAIPEGGKVTVDGTATAKDGGRWLHVKYGSLRGYVSADYVRR